MYKNSNNVGKNKWLQAQTLNKKLQEKAQTHDDDGRQAFSALYTTHLGTISQH